MNTENSLVIFSKAAILLAEADTIQKAKELKDMAIVAGEWARRRRKGKEAILHCWSYSLRAERKIGELLIAGREDGTIRDRGNIFKCTDVVPLDLVDLELSRKDGALAVALADLPSDIFESILSQKITVAQAIRDFNRKTKIKQIEAIAKSSPNNITGLFDVIVIDPPWPIQKLERDCRPNQVAPLDYPTLTIEQIANLKIGIRSIPQLTATDCHVFLWTTHRFLPDAFNLLNQWNFIYSMTFVWHKPGGFQPVNMPQFNCEFCLYARKGHPIFADTKDLFACFSAERGQHSQKPAEFYQTISRTTAGRRLDLFARGKPHPGFINWGNQAAS